DRSRSDADQNFVVSRCRLLDFSQLKIPYAILAGQDRFHGMSRIFGDLHAVVCRSPVAHEQPGDERDQNCKETPFENAFDFHRPNESCTVAYARPMATYRKKRQPDTHCDVDEANKRKTDV